MPRVFTIPVRDFQAFRDFSILLDGSQNSRIDQEAAITQPAGQWWVDGYCEVCEADRELLVDYQYGGDRVNWRERLECSGCCLNNRMRAALALAKMRLSPDAHIYLTENVTPLYRQTAKVFSRVIGSEFMPEVPLGKQRDRIRSEGITQLIYRQAAKVFSKVIGSEFMPEVPLGKQRDGIRSEDITQLTFGEQFDAVMTFDVLEHVPDYRQGLREFARVLKPGGWLIMTVPYDLSAPETLVRAILVGGKIVHLERPEYHGDPMNGDGILSFYTFGWSLLDDLREVGLNPQLEFFWSRRHAYVGGLQFIIVAQKRGAS